MVNVFLTVDTELWPAVAGWPRNPLPSGKSDFTHEFEACILGRTTEGDYGLPYQLQLLNAHRLKAVYLVEPFFSYVAGQDLLRQIVGWVQQGGHELGLHPHTEWLGEIKAAGLPAQYGPVIRGYPVQEQQAIIQYGLKLFEAAGAPAVQVYRAGSYGANRDTLAALAAAGIRFDTSYNLPFPDSFPDWPPAAPPEQPVAVGPVWEYPVSNFVDYPGHIRHVQLCACSFREMRHLLLQASKTGRSFFVIVLHSFELVRRRLRADGQYEVKPNRVVIRRFQRLCRFLDQHRDKFKTQGLADVPETLLGATPTVPSLQSTLLNTGLRQMEQFASKWI